MAVNKKSSPAKDSVKKSTKNTTKKSILKEVKAPVVPDSQPTVDPKQSGFFSFIGSLLTKGKDKSVSLLKSIKPIYLILGCIVLSVVVYFWLSKPDAYKQENKKLKKEIIQIQKERDKISDSLKTLKYDYSILEDSANVKLQLLDEINQRMILLEQRVSTSFDQLSKIQSGVNVINTQIKNTTENPSKRTGDDLIKSLKNKIN